jgi:type IV secretion system protein VirB9
MKEVPYNRADVVRIVGHYGYSTDVEFSPGETTQDIALGDSLAWEVAPAGNHLFVKPREDNAVTNMTVVTNKRVYQLALDARDAAGPTSGMTKSMFFQVRFTYPDEDAAKLKTAFDARVTEAKKRQMESAMRKLPEQRNWNYFACGTKMIRPVEVFDDGRFTFMRFPGAQEIPAIYMINADGTESIVNGGMKGEHYVVQTTASRFVLRRGKSVACIENRSFNPYGITTPTGTISPDIRREVRSLPSSSTLSVLPLPSKEVPTSTGNGPGAGSQPLPSRFGTDGKPVSPAGVSAGVTPMGGVQ